MPILNAALTQTASARASAPWAPSQRPCVVRKPGNAIRAQPPLTRSVDNLAPVVLLALLAGCAPAVPAGAAGRPDPTTGISRGDHPVQAGSHWLDADRCARCHDEAHESWTGSRHAASYTNPVFQASFHTAVLRGWCLNCHAPLPEQQEAIRAGEHNNPLVQQGVSCAVCHVRDRTILTPSPPSRLAQLAHRAEHSTALRESDFCGGCHQFRAPSHDGSQLQIGAPLQDTLSEWEHSAAARDGQRCQDCHMPDGVHEFRGAHDPSMLRSALRVRTETDGRRLRLIVETTDKVGHAVPSGDPFRRLELRACEDARCAVVLAQKTLGRAHAVDGDTWQLVADQTLGPPGGDRPTAVSWTLPDGVVRWEVRYAYAAARDEADLPPDEAYTIIAAGAIPSE